MARTLVILTNPGYLPENNLLDGLQAQSKEIVFVLIWKDFSICTQQRLSPWKYLTVLKTMLDEYISIPYHLFPLDATGLTHFETLNRLNHFSPAFEKIICDDVEMVDTANMLFENNAYHFPFEQPVAAYTTLKKRSVFITRAQIFHNGHAAFINRIMDKNDEVIMIIANAEKAFLPDNPATAAERLVMVKAYLEETYPKQHWIIPLPYHPFIAENFTLLKWLIPEFQGIYSTNAITNQMAKHAGYTVTIPTIKSKVRGEILRERIVKEEDISDSVPQPTLKEFYNLEIDKRMIELNP